MMYYMTIGTTANAHVNDGTRVLYPTTIARRTRGADAPVRCWYKCCMRLSVVINCTLAHIYIIKLFFYFLRSSVSPIVGVGCWVYIYIYYIYNVKCWKKNSTNHRVFGHGCNKSASVRTGAASMACVQGVGGKGLGRTRKKK